MPILQPTSGAGYPSIALVNDFVRIHVNDTFAGATGTVGEGRVYTNDWTPNLNVLNLALQHLQRDLEDRGVSTTREDQFIINGITPINGPAGLGVPDPALQVYISFAGYWDGQFLNTAVPLPYDLLAPIKIRQRITSSGFNFTLLPEMVDGLASGYQTGWSLGGWEWRQDALWFNGSQQTMDIELRYTGGVPTYPTNLNPNLFASTLIPFLDSAEALSYRCAYVFCSPRLPKGGADELQANYEAAMIKMANRYIKTAQRTPVARQPFGGWGGQSGGFNSGAGW